MNINAARLAEFDTIELQAGAHSPDHTFCVMEAVAYVAGEPWTDKPECACPVLTAFMIAWNDGSTHEQRQELKPWIPRLAGTRSTREVELRRSSMACDWLVRTFTPTWFRSAGLVEDAAAFEGLPELTSTELVNAALPTIRAAQKKAVAAAEAAAWDAAWDAARAAAWDAARAAAWDAAEAAAWDAARAAAWDAARDALAPTFTELRASAFNLLDRMIAVTAA